MKFLILSTATGQGHNSASLAVRECLEARGCRAEVLDVLKLRNSKTSRHVSCLYADVTVHVPYLFGLLYRAGMSLSRPGGCSPIFFLNTFYAKQLCSKICTYRPDVIVCPHIFSAQAVTWLRRKSGLTVPAVGLVTDYTCIPFWEESALDSYIIPSASLAAEFIQRGIPADRLVPIGIPVRSQFLRHTQKSEARQRLGLSLSGYIFLVMGGSMGYGNLAALAEGLLSAVPGSRVVALCGNNIPLFRKLSSMSHCITPLCYTEKVGLYMDAADVVLTKPGGLSSTEAIAKHIPTVLTHPIPGCEQQNAAFLARHGAAIFADSISRAVLEACHLALDKEAARKMAEAQEQFYPADTDSRIADYLISLAPPPCNSISL